MDPLLLTAASLALLHTLLGPDHYIPFAAIARARGWSRQKTMLVVIACGLAHVCSSVILGLIGIVFGLALVRLTHVEAWRGSAAGWLLLAFGLIYTVWGLRRAFRAKRHTHWHSHHGGLRHLHEHAHQGEHLHIEGAAKSVTPWALFLIFVFGPCEPLIPLLLYPAAQQHAAQFFAVASVFGLVTIVTMLAAVFALESGLRLVRVDALAPYGHALAGFAILLCGITVQFAGL